MNPSADFAGDLDSPLRQPAFLKLFTAQVVALVGTGLTTVALALLAYDLAAGNAGVVLGTALAFKMVAYVVFAPIVGGLAHRFARKPLLITLDVIRAAIVLLMPFVTAVWQVYLLIFLLNLFSAGFKPVFAATIPDILPNERQYTKALSYSRIAYDLETLLSPTLAGLALLYTSYTGLFAGNSVAFLVSALLIFFTVLPKSVPEDRIGGVWQQISFGVSAYLRTPRLRALLTLYLAVACASAMVIVNSVVYVKEYLAGSDEQLAMVFAAAGFGSMFAALLLPKVIDRVGDRRLMLLGAACMSAGVFAIAAEPAFAIVLPIWALIGLGLSLVQTPSGRIVNRSARASDRSAYFAAQFALSHACWLLAYPVAGYLGKQLGLPMTATVLGVVILAFSVLAAVIWPRGDEAALAHIHQETEHEHMHTHGLHHQHEHQGDEGPEPHSHSHHHTAEQHEHDFVIDEHHAQWPMARTS